MICITEFLNNEFKHILFGQTIRAFRLDILL